MQSYTTDDAATQIEKRRKIKRVNRNKVEGTKIVTYESVG